MKQSTLFLAFLIFIPLLISTTIFAHVGERYSVKSETFYLNGQPIEGHFLMTKDDKIFIELSDGKAISASLTDFSFSNQNNLSQKIARLKRLNADKTLTKTERLSLHFSNFSIFFLLSIIVITFLFIQNRNSNQFSKYFWKFHRLYLRL